jgi:hypothetical protein
MKITKKSLHKRFTASLDALGVYFGDDHTGLSEEDYVAAGHDPQWFDETALLPGGGSLGICTYCADYVIRTLGHGARYGFLVENNPSVTDYEIRSSGGHDFAVIEGRYIVDPWYALNNNRQGVFDLKSASDREMIKGIYGDPDCWKYYDPVAEKQIQMNSPDLPSEFFVQYPAIRKHEEVEVTP